MSGSTNRRQLGLVLAPEDDDLLRELHAAREEEVGQPLALSGYVAWLVREEARRQGIGQRRTGKGTKRGR